jgi:hypothetical protein
MITTNTIKIPQHIPLAISQGLNSIYWLQTPEQIQFREAVEVMFVQQHRIPTQFQKAKKGDVWRGIKQGHIAQAIAKHVNFPIGKWSVGMPENNDRSQAKTRY